MSLTSFSSRFHGPIVPKSRRAYYTRQTIRIDERRPRPPAKISRARERIKKKKKKRFYKTHTACPYTRGRNAYFAIRRTGRRRHSKRTLGIISAARTIFVTVTARQDEHRRYLLYSLHALVRTAGMAWHGMACHTRVCTHIMGSFGPDAFRVRWRVRLAVSRFAGTFRAKYFCQKREKNYHDRNRPSSHDRDFSTRSPPTTPTFRATA